MLTGFGEQWLSSSENACAPLCGMLDRSRSRLDLISTLTEGTSTILRGTGEKEFFLSRTAQPPDPAIVAGSDWPDPDTDRARRMLADPPRARKRSTALASAARSSAISWLVGGCGRWRRSALIASARSRRGRSSRRKSCSDAPADLANLRQRPPAPDNRRCRSINTPSASTNCASPDRIG